LFDHPVDGFVTADRPQVSSLPAIGFDYLHYHFLKVWAIRFIRRDFGGFRFARIHPDYGLFKAWD